MLKMGQYWRHGWGELEILKVHYMVERRSVYLITCIALFFSLDAPVVSNEKIHIAISKSEAMEHEPTMFEPVREPLTIQQTVDMSDSHLCKILGTKPVEEHPQMLGIDKFSDVIPIDQIMKEEEKSSYVIMTGLYFTEKIYINENQIIEVWSQNISSESRILYHKIFGRYPDGSSFYGESDHIQIQPGKWLLTYFTIYLNLPP